MAYKFAFDLSGLSRSFFKEIAKVSDQKSLHRKLGTLIERMVETFNIREITGLPLSDAVTLLNDMVDIYARNLSQENSFRRAEKRALFLPHCARKYMDGRCQAKFDPRFSTYQCQHCSEDCLVNQAVRMGEKNGYDVYVLPGGSCIPKILSQRHYDGVVGVACPNEIELAIRELGTRESRPRESRPVLAFQAVPLLRNGCANTVFNMDTLEHVMVDSR